MVNLQNISDQQLIEELERRKQNKLAQERKDRLEMCKRVLQHKDVLLSLMDHSRISCETVDNSSYHPQHGSAYCNKCCLANLTLRDDIQIAVEVRLEKVDSSTVTNPELF